MLVHVIFNLKDCNQDSYHFAARGALVEPKGELCMLPQLKPDRKKQFLKTYQSITDSMAEVNQNNELYWYTTFATQNIMHSSFYCGLDSVFRLQQLVAETAKTSITLYCDDPTWYPFIKAIVLVSGHQLKLSTAQRFKVFKCWFTSYYLRLKAYYNVFRFMQTLVKGKRKDPNQLPKDIDLIFVSVWFLKTLRQDVARDPFFGDLPIQCKQHGLNPMYFAHIDNYSADNLSLLDKFKATPVATYAHFLSLYHVLQIIIKALRFSSKLLNNQEVFGVRTKTVIQNDISSSASRHVCYSLLMKKCMLILLKRYPKAKLIHMYEGNPWEYGCIRSAKVLQRICIGYQHCAILPIYFKMRNSSTGIKPMPNYIITSGENAKKILVDYWGHDSAKTIGSCAFRQADIYKYSAKENLNNSAENILILLQGLPSDVRMIKMIASLLQSKIPRNISVRHHPAARLSFDYATLCCDPLVTMVDSTQPNLYQDVLNADIVLYNGTTAALEAIALGVPALHINLNESVSVDPIFEKPGLSATYNPEDDLLQSCDTMLLRTAKNHQREWQMARAYYQTYFSEQTADKVAFLVDKLQKM